MNEIIVNLLSGMVRNATPLVIVTLGETITERAGVINLSLNGSIILSAMVGFVTALKTESIFVGVIVAMAVGAFIALIIAVANIELRQSQVAIGFILTLLCTDLAQLLGTDYTHIPGPLITNFQIPLLSDIPIIGQIFFSHDWTVYVSYALMIGIWFWFFKTNPGLAHRAVGEQPNAAYVRGTRVNLQRYMYTILGGGLVGLGGVAYSLKLKPGWSTPPSMDGDGWIALAIVIFGGWHPIRVIIGVYLFAALRSLSSALQPGDFGFAVPLLNMIPWLVLIIILILVSGGFIEQLTHVLPEPIKKRMQTFLHSSPPNALGRRFEPK